MPPENLNLLRPKLLGWRQKNKKHRKKREREIVTLPRLSKNCILITKKKQQNLSNLESDRKTRRRRERKEIGKDLLEAFYIFIEKSKQVSSKKRT